MTIWKVWTFAATHDLTGAYGVGGSPPERRVLHWQGEELSVDYPPLTLAELAVSGRFYERRHPLFEDSNAFNVAVKLPGLAAEIALVTLVLTLGRRRFGADAAAWTTLALWLNPAVLLDGPVLGYLDLQMAVPAVLALAAAWAGAGWLAGALAAIAVLTKPQALFVCPVIAAAVVASDRRLRAAAQGAVAAALTAVVVLMPFLVRGAWANFVQAMSRLGTHDMLSAQASNAWWIFTWILRVLDVAGEWGWRGALTQEVRILAISRAIALGYPNPRVVGGVLVVGALTWAAWRARRLEIARRPRRAGRLVCLRLRGARGAGPREPSLPCRAVPLHGRRPESPVRTAALGGVGDRDGESAALLWTRTGSADPCRAELDRDRRVGPARLRQRRRVRLDDREPFASDPARAQP